MGGCGCRLGYKCDYEGRVRVRVRVMVRVRVRVRGASVTTRAWSGVRVHRLSGLSRASLG